jgi:hypothetical protein
MATVMATAMDMALAMTGMVQANVGHKVMPLTFS